MPNNFFKRLTSAVEGKILIINLLFMLLYTLSVFLVSFYSKELFQKLLGITTTHLLFGRAAALSFGYTVKITHWLNIFLNIILETLLVLFYYPIFVLIFQRLLKIKWLNNFFKKSKKTAKEYEPFIHKYGLIALFIFVWFPFWMTGPVIGAIIGFFIGLNIWLNLSLVLSGTYIAIITWAIFLKKIYIKLHEIGYYAPTIFLVVFILIIILFTYLYHKKVTKK